MKEASAPAGSLVLLATLYQAFSSRLPTLTRRGALERERVLATEYRVYRPVGFGRVLQAVVVVLVVDDVEVGCEALPVHVLVQRQAKVGPRVGLGLGGGGGGGAREAMALHALEAHLLDGGGDLREGRDEGRKERDYRTCQVMLSHLSPSHHH